MVYGLPQAFGFRSDVIVNDNNIKLCIGA